MKQLIADVEKRAIRYGVKIKLEKADLVYAPGEDYGCAGYFDSERKVLAVATKGKILDWLAVFIHESCHMDQWIENKFMWEKLTHGYTIFFEWLYEKKIVKREILEEAVSDIIRLEKDCEERTVKKIQKYGIEINIDDYKRKANSYLFAYLYFLEKKKWIPKIYANEEVWRKAPMRFKKEYKKIPQRLYNAFKNSERLGTESKG